ncbi:MAG: polyphosphate kinase [Sphingobacteriales bacterium]|nr:polyphosphate kinase [Sphingobacteriales bacterium]
MGLLSKISTKPDSNIKAQKETLEEQAEELKDELSELQNKMFAQQQRALLVILQGMDASGKDGVVRKAFGKVNPAGCVVQSFKRPTDIEMAHDFLWRVHQVVPAKGYIGIFNRSHYEDVLVQRVHKWVDMDTVRRRFEHINHFEQLLEDNGTKVLKFYMHISKDEQLKRLQERLDKPEKRWKHNEGDWKEREFWSDYMEAYEDVFEHCSPALPWYIVPSDDNWYKEFTVLKTVVETLRTMDLAYPQG